MADSFKTFLENFNANGPSACGVIEAAERYFDCVLPGQYKNFMEAHNGGEGFIMKQYLILWRTAELIEFNRDYEVARYAPGLLLFGSTGGGEAFAFDLRETDRMKVRMVPFVGMCLKDAKLVADTFETLLIASSNPMTYFPKDQRHQGKELFFITPIILGGSPGASNIVYLDRRQHIEAVRYWNRIIDDLRKQQTKS